MNDNDTRIGRRGVPAVLLVAALLAFLMPFATVSCGTPVTFTGVELVTARVEGDDPELVAEIEDYTPIAAFAALAALLALGLAGAGTRGVGSAALAALLALLYLPWAAAFELADVSVHAGYMSSVLFLATVVVLRALALRHRRRGVGMKVWPVTVGTTLVVLAFVLTLLLGVGG